MKIIVRVEPQARERKVEKIGERCFRVRTTKPAKEGKANSDVIELLSDYLGVSKSNIEIISGHRAKEKIMMIDGL
ncbi:MAG: hypothetical protein LiPW41_394 [Parcubacteria group bacterium LiPW_41]|nr:MAG: hypothetical protein LiPW41_394 [Parcubacteria group bacterium LiPW_41]